MKKLDAEICRATECEYDHYLCGHNSGCSIYRCVESLIEKRLAEKPDTMELIVLECKKYHDKGCIGCAFDIIEGNGIDIRCDGGVYRKDRLNVQEIKARLKI